MRRNLGLIRARQHCVSTGDTSNCQLLTITSADSGKRLFMHGLSLSWVKKTQVVYNL